MKKKLLILTAICFLFSFVCGCAREIPEYLPGEREGDSQFVWVCQEPFGFFSTPAVKERYYGFLKGYLEKEGEFVYFYSALETLDGTTCFQEEKKWLDPSEYDSFWGYADHYEDYFEFEVERDNINFFDGELPELRFDKMTKEAFLEQYGDIENIAELLAAAEASTDEDASSAE